MIQELVDDPSVTEIMVNGYRNIFVEKKRKKSENGRRPFSSEERLWDVIQQIAGRCNRVVNEETPILDARLANGARVNAVLPPVSLDGPVLTIRRFPDEPITMVKLGRLGQHYTGSGGFPEETCIVRLYHIGWRRYLHRQDHVFKCFVSLYSQRRRGL